MKKQCLLFLVFFIVMLLLGCNPISKEDEKKELDKEIYVTHGTEIYREFRIDNILHVDTEEIHFHLYIPKEYDGTKAHALFITLCGYGGYYFQGVGVNLKLEEFAFEAQKYNKEMIIVAPQLNDWQETSANQAIILTQYFISHYNIDKEKVYMNGYSGGGETLSLVMEKSPELYSKVLHISSIWDGDIKILAKYKIPIYFVIGKDDEYYGSSRIKKTYEKLCEIYKKEGLDDTQISKLAQLDIKDAQYFNSFNFTNQHGGGSLIAYDRNIMEWLLNG